MPVISVTSGNWGYFQLPQWGSVVSVVKFDYLQLHL